MADPIPTSLLAALSDLMRWLDAMKMPSMVIGGVAASVLGEPRLTQDIDALAIVPEADWDAALAGAAPFGIVARIESMSDMLEEFDKLVASRNPKR